MWLYYLLLTVGAAKTVSGQDSKVSIAGTGTISRNGKTSLNIQVEIDGLGPGSPGAGVGGLGVGGGAAGAGVGEKAIGTFSDEEQAGLEKHNAFRMIHDAPDMTLNKQMCEEAKAYAEQLAQMGTLTHSSSGDGENLSMGCSTNKAQTMEEAVTNWYNEVCQPGYNFDSGGFSGGTGHFTQVVWKESTELGIGRAETQQSGMKCAYIVGRYRPAGNMMGDFANNVVKGRFDASSYCSSVSNPGWKKKFLDKQGRAMATILTKDSEHAQRVSTGSAEFRKQRLEVLKKKKTTVAKKHD